MIVFQPPSISWPCYSCSTLDTLLSCLSQQKLDRPYTKELILMAEKQSERAPNEGTAQSLFASKESVWKPFT